MAWFACGQPGVTAAGTDYFYFPYRAFDYAQVVAKFPNDTIVPFAFQSKQACQSYCDKQNNTVSGGGGSGKGGKPTGKGTHGTKNRKVSGAAIVAQARKWLGVPYLFGGTTRQGVDCSGLVMNVAHELGIDSCPRTSEAQYAWCEKISESEAGSGDLVFFVGAPEEAGPPGHVGIIVSPGQMIDAPFPGTVVRVDHFVMSTPSHNTSNEGNIWGYGRMRGAAKSSSANPYLKGGTAAGVTSAAGATIGAGITPVIVVIAIAVVVLLLFVLLAGVSILWRAS